MVRTVSIGNQDFEKIRERNCFYVDKTRFIKEWWEQGDEVTLITRPRRFGKSLSLLPAVCSTPLLRRILIWSGPL